jgi:isovaleryl-CoA dehydrogenase
MSGLNFGLGETVDLLRQQVADFASAEIAPHAAEIDRANRQSCSGPNICPS